MSQQTEPVSGRYDPDFAANPAITAFLADLGQDAALRERERSFPYDFVRRFADLRLGSLRVPEAFGGHGWTLPELLGFIAALGEADSNFAHAVRNHFLFTEMARVLPDSDRRARWLGLVAAGAILGDANSEKTGAMSQRGTKLTPVAGGWRVSGTKYYSTGCLYADWIFISADDDQGALRLLVLPVDAPGLELIDDWNGIGQRLSASGTTVLRDVFIPEGDVLIDDWTNLRDRPRQGPFAQLYLTTVVAGIASGAVAEAIGNLRGRGRNYPHGLHESPREDALLLAEAGHLAALAFAVRATVEKAALALQRLVVGHAAGHDLPALQSAASLAAAQAKLVVDRLTQELTTRVFDLGGASLTDRDLGLDRHWRNARTLASHNPRAAKALGVGRHLVNGADLPAHFF